jgi:hypothetical protein
MDTCGPDRYSYCRDFVGIGREEGIETITPATIRTGTVKSSASGQFTTTMTRYGGQKFFIIELPGINHLAGDELKI